MRGPHGPWGAPSRTTTRDPDSLGGPGMVPRLRLWAGRQARWPYLCLPHPFLLPAEGSPGALGHCWPRVRPPALGWGFEG